MAHHEKKEHESKHEKDGKHMAHKSEHHKGMAHAKGGKGFVAGPAAHLKSMTKGK